MTFSKSLVSDPFKGLYLDADPIWPLEFNIYINPSKGL
jgi:hypothetical protein